MQNHNYMLSRPVMACMTVLIACMACSLTASAANVYVVPPGTHEVDPGWVYTNWATAATNIQDAIDAAHVGDGDIVFITNGTYLLSDQITVEKGVILRSYMDGATAPEETFIDGNNYEGKPVTNRVMEIDHEGAVLDGLTIQGGIGRGAGIHIDSSGLITNCIIFNNHAEGTAVGGGIATVGNERDVGLITHCRIISNTASQGGGIYINRDCIGIVEYCTIEWNSTRASASTDGGGGIRGATSGTNMIFRWSTIANNTAAASGGGVNMWYSGRVENCVIVSNTQTSAGTSRDGAGMYFYARGTHDDIIVRNCLIAHNTGGSASKAAVAIYVNKDSATPDNEVTAYIQNCTIAGHTMRGFHRLKHTEETVDSMVLLINNVIYDNSVNVITNYATIFSNCLSNVALPGTGNITNIPPIFADDEFRLAPDSSGINAGVNLGWMDGALDRDGNPRIDSLFRRVDMGCYEYMFSGTIFQFY